MTLPFVISLGANLGDRRATLARAVALLGDVEGVRVGRVSSLYETAPWGRTDQPDFLNAVVVGETTLTPEQLLAQTQRIETALGRVRHEHWGPRAIDLDLVAMGDEARETPELRLPHPLAAERAFVMAPWHEVDPDGAAALGPVPAGDVRRVGELS